MGVRDSVARRVSAASGIGFVVLIMTGAIIGQVKHFSHFGNVVGASNEVFGTTMLFTGVGGALLLIFGARFAAHIRHAVEGGDRLAAALVTSSAVIFGLLALAVSVAYMARATHLPALVALGTGIIDGPALFFPAAVFVGAGAMAMLREEDVPTYTWIAGVLSVGLTLAYIAGAGLMLFKDYAWINDTGYITFLAYTLIVSTIGIVDWGMMRAAPEEPVEPHQTVQPRAMSTRARVRKAS